MSANGELDERLGEEDGSGLTEAVEQSMHRRLAQRRRGRAALSLRQRPRLG